MSSVSEQDHLNPRDPLYYAPRWLRERSASVRDGSPEKPYSPPSFENQLESVVSDALRHPLDPEVMHEPAADSKKALWTVAARFSAAIGVAAAVALFFVVAVPMLKQSDGDASAFVGVAESIKATFQPGESVSKPAISEFQSILATTPPASAATPEQSGQLLNQFMQWRENPASAPPSRSNQ